MGKKKHRLYTVNVEPESCEEDEKGHDALHATQGPIEHFYSLLDSNQLNYVSSIGPKRVVMTDSPAGTGKTSLAVMRALEMLRKGQIDRIQYVRFPDRRTMKLGFIPGNVKEKEYGFMHPFYEAAIECGLSKENIEKLITSEVIELSTDIFLRGRTLSRTFLIIDESQNGDIDDLRLVLTRLHIEGYGVVIGHSGQMDNPKLAKYGKENLNAFEVYQRHMNKKDFTKVCRLVNDYRGPISQWADNVEETLNELTI